MNKKGKSTLEKFALNLKVKNYSKRTIEIYCHYLEKFILSIDKPALHVTTKEIERYLLNFKYSSISQQNQIYSSLKLFSKHILKIKYINKVFTERPKKEKNLPQIIDKKYLIDKINEIKNLKHKAIISLGYSTGLRISEVLNLKISDIDSKRMIITIRRSKGRKDRIVPLSINILILLRKYYKEFRPKEYLFNGQNSPTYSTTSCNNIVKKYLGAKYHFHLLRHSCFTNLLESGVDIRIIQKLAGHSSSKTTEIYTHVSRQTLQNLPLPI